MKHNFLTIHPNIVRLAFVQLRLNKQTSYQDSKINHK